jgi:hypothetical protein
MRRLLLPLLLGSFLWVAESSSEEVPVHVDRIAPLKERLPMLKFLRANRDFLRGRADLLRARAALGAKDGAIIDARLIDYPALREAALLESDRLGALSDSLSGLRALARIEELLALAGEMDRLEKDFDAGAERLARLEADFGRLPMTGLIVLLRGVPEAPIDSLVVTNDLDERWAFPMTESVLEGLRHGGLARVLYEYAEPRRQVLFLNPRGPTWSSAAAQQLEFEPPLDRVTVLEIDLSPWSPTGQAAPGVRAWLDEPLVGDAASKGNR